MSRQPANPGTTQKAKRNTTQQHECPAAGALIAVCIWDSNNLGYIYDLSTGMDSNDLMRALYTKTYLLKSRDSTFDVVDQGTLYTDGSALYDRMAMESERIDSHQDILS
ncbi:hypothetical protein AOL_s00170g48 [Orbilia oligospora ATCC 24927]|uniref:Uncharacterized protein n=2 Tax=Orbilia oligospora TaxID=2813651 RepID=G1XN82_ARTOA|nr:hypothetical protein AOL_s00170g48 [Orbilia oligospora ATCC 24927]EGX45341.1 hypothetical protein AOL_s00170g48 [Orbilia oligospora ATCC 24927]KAF3274286.1 hypothetical protein TWF970_008036 [Orbilia oligospora]